MCRRRVSAALQLNKQEACCGRNGISCEVEPRSVAPRCRSLLLPQILRPLSRSLLYYNALRNQGEGRGVRGKITKVCKQDHADNLAGSNASRRQGWLKRTLPWSSIASKKTEKEGGRGRKREAKRGHKRAKKFRVIQHVQIKKRARAREGRGRKENGKHKLWKRNERGKGAGGATPKSELIRL